MGGREGGAVVGRFNQYLPGRMDERWMISGQETVFCWVFSSLADPWWLSFSCFCFCFFYYLPAS